MNTKRAVTALAVLFFFTGSLFAMDQRNQKACLESPGDDQAFATAFIGALTAKKVPMAMLANCQGAGSDIWRVNLSSSQIVFQLASGRT